MLFGESDGEDSFYRCPGAGCDFWDATGGDYEERSKVCLDCTRCKGKPPLLNKSTSSPEEIQKRVVGRIENLVHQQNAGMLDLNSLEFWEWRLIEIWRNEELQRQRELSMYPKFIYEAFTKQ